MRYIIIYLFVCFSFIAESQHKTRP